MILLYHSYPKARRVVLILLYKYSKTLINSGRDTFLSQLCKKNERIPKTGVVIIYQELALIPDLTVYENIFLGHEIKSGLKTIFSD